MKFATLFIAVLACLSTVPLQAQSDAFLGEYPLGGSLETLSVKIEANAGAIERYDAPKVRFPQALKAETHILARDLQVAGGTLERAVFTFADGKLVAMQGRGGVNALLDAAGPGSYQTYDAYRFYGDAGVVVHPGQDRLWLLDEEGMHLNLFGWKHPMLEAGFDGWPDEPGSVEVPEYLRMGASLAELEPSLKQASELIIRDTLDGSDPNAQLQLNCYGIPFAGFSRKVEARFGNDTLNTVWILTARAEEDRLRKQLTGRYGPPVFVSDAWEAFSDWQVFLRKDKPEILLLTPKLGHFYRDTYFTKQPDGE